jgi:hypothetical protein
LKAAIVWKRCNRFRVFDIISFFNLYSVLKPNASKLQSNPTYTISWPDGRTTILERFADGWYMPGNLEHHWTGTGIAELGHLMPLMNKPPSRLTPLIDAGAINNNYGSPGSILITNGVFENVPVFY